MVVKLDRLNLIDMLKKLDENEVNYYVDIDGVDGRLVTLVIDLLANRVLVISYKDNYEIDRKIYNHEDWEFDAFEMILLDFWRNREIEHIKNKPA